MKTIPILILLSVTLGHPVWAQTADSYYQQGQTALTLGQPGKAQRLLAMSLRQDPSYISAHLALINLCMAQGRYEVGLTQIEQALTHAPTHAELWVLKGQLLGMVGDDTEADLAFTEALTQAPDNLPILDRALAFYRDVGDTARVAELTALRTALITP